MGANPCQAVRKSLDDSRTNKKVATWYLVDAVGKFYNKERLDAMKRVGLYKTVDRTQQRKNKMEKAECKLINARMKLTQYVVKRQQELALLQEKLQTKPLDTSWFNIEKYEDDETDIWELTLQVGSFLKEYEKYKRLLSQENEKPKLNPKKPAAKKAL